MENFIRVCKKYFGYAMFFSMFTNVLQLTFSIYMLQVYDKVLTSYNFSTLVVITIAAIIALMTLGALEWIRSRLLIRAGIEFDNQLSSPILVSELKRSAELQKKNAQGEIKDVQSLRAFLGSSAVFAFFDIPWMPLYFALIFILHPALGWVAVLGGIIIFFLGFMTQKITNPKLIKANKSNRAAQNLLATATRNAYVINSMGMINSISKRWHHLNNEVVHLQMKASLSAGLLHSISRSFRLGVQVIIYAVGAYLVITHQTTAGVIIAASIIMGRALSPVDQAMATYKQSIEAFGAYKRIRDTLTGQTTTQKMQLPVPMGDLGAEAVSFVLHGRVILQNISFKIKHGTILAIIGPSASGKSTFCKLLLGIWPLTSGKITLDNADLNLWSSDDLGKYIGYLPQDVELFSGTIAENIARMGEVDSNEVIRVAKLTGVHELILSLPKGYDTYINELGHGISGGQRQRIGLARALYGDPCVVILDEPNSNLDEEGDARLMQCLVQLRQAKKTVLVITHKPTLLSVVDEIMALLNGQIFIYGQSGAVLQKMSEMREQQKKALEQKHVAKTS